MRALLLILVYCAIQGCSDEPTPPVQPLCYEEPHNPWCVLMSFATLDDGMVVGRANDLDHTTYGVQYDIRLKLSRAMPGGYATLVRNDVDESRRIVPSNSDNIGFAAYTLNVGENRLVASLYTGDGLLIDRVAITIYVE